MAATNANKTSKPNSNENQASGSSQAKTSKKGKALEVRSFGPSFRRAGLEFTQEPRKIPIEDLTEDQIEALKGERMLSVVEVDL